MWLPASCVVSSTDAASVQSYPCRDGLPLTPHAPVNIPNKLTGSSRQTWLDGSFGNSLVPWLGQDGSGLPLLHYCLVHSQPCRTQ